MVGLTVASSSRNENGSRNSRIDSLLNFFEKRARQSDGLYLRLTQCVGNVLVKKGKVVGRRSVRAKKTNPGTGRRCCIFSTRLNWQIHERIPFYGFLVSKVAQPIS